MRITSSKPKGQRIYKCLKINDNKFGRTKRPFWIEPEEVGLWFDAEKREWIKDSKCLKGLHSAYYSMKHEGLSNAYSLKAVIRLISKWKAPKGTKFRASLPYVGYDFFITKK